MEGDGRGLRLDGGVKELTGRWKNSEREGLYRERSFFNWDGLF